MFKSTVSLINKSYAIALLSYCPTCCSNRLSQLGSAYFSTLLSVDSQSEKLEKSINVSIIGVPNAGKSTLINSLVDRRVCAASNKVHTTETVARAISVTGRTQIVFLDTPGIVTQSEQKKFNLKKSMVVDPHQSLKKADIVGVIHDVGNKWKRDSLDPMLIDILKQNDSIPSFLIVNKVDLLKSKRKLLDVIKIVTKGQVAGLPINDDENFKRRKQPLMERGYDGFSDVFMISALDGDGVGRIKDYILHNAKPRKWPYPEYLWSDRKPETLIMETVRATFLDFFSQEIPYKLIIEMELFEENEEKVIALVAVTCPSRRLETLIAGAAGGKLKQVTDSARQNLVDMFQKSVSLTITLRTENQNRVPD